MLILNVHNQINLHGNQVICVHLEKFTLVHFLSSCLNSHPDPLIYFIIHISIYYRNNNKYKINHLCCTKMKTIKFFFSSRIQKVCQQKYYNPRKTRCTAFTSFFFFFFLIGFHLNHLVLPCCNRGTKVFLNAANSKWTNSCQMGHLN